MQGIQHNIVIVYVTFLQKKFKFSTMFHLEKGMCNMWLTFALEESNGRVATMEDCSGNVKWKSIYLV